MTEFRDGSGLTVKKGYENRNRQKCHGHRGRPGIAIAQNAYKMECLVCGYIYGANGFDVHRRQCPRCRPDLKAVDIDF